MVLAVRISTIGQCTNICIPQRVDTSVLHLVEMVVNCWIQGDMQRLTVAQEAAAKASAEAKEAHAVAAAERRRYTAVPATYCPRPCGLFT